MRYTKTLGLFASAIILGLVFMASSTSAQVRFGVRIGHPIYRPFFGPRYYVPPITYYGYYDGPYWWHSQKYEDKKALEKAEDHLEKDKLKYNAKGYVTAKEQAKLDKDQYEVDRAQRRVDDDR